MKKLKSTDSKATVAKAGASPTTSSQPPVEIIIKVSCNDGDWILFGREKSPADGWEFAAEMHKTETRSASTSEWVSDWNSALKLYAKKPWQSLYPREVHKDFRTAVELALMEQLMQDGQLAAQNERDISLNNWLRLCDEQVQEKILQVLPADGGEYWTLFGIRDGRNGWHFYTDWSLHEEEPVARLIPQNQPLPVAVPTWDEALELFDQREWAKSYPIYIHPEFRVRVKSLLMRRKFGRISQSWKRLIA